MASIYIVAVTPAAVFRREPLENSIRKTFGMETIFADDWRIDLAKTYDAGRDQYNSSGLLLQLLEKMPADATKILGIVDVDLFIPILTFVFGEAQLDGIGSVVSLHRLNNTFYGLSPDEDLLTERLMKESIHELGHTFGLIHCNNPGCVLNASTYVENIDQKSAEFCGKCREELRPTLERHRSWKAIR